jgi:hypothetical protein
MESGPSSCAWACAVTGEKIAIPAPKKTADRSHTPTAGPSI